MILKMDVKSKLDGKVWNTFMWPRIRTSDGMLQTWYWDVCVVYKAGNVWTR
jgi:hypothetical protein